GRDIVIIDPAIERLAHDSIRRALLLPHHDDAAHRDDRKLFARVPVRSSLHGCLPNVYCVRASRRYFTWMSRKRRLRPPKWTALPRSAGGVKGMVPGKYGSTASSTSEGPSGIPACGFFAVRRSSTACC